MEFLARYARLLYYIKLIKYSLFTGLFSDSIPNSLLFRCLFHFTFPTVRFPFSHCPFPFFPLSVSLFPTVRFLFSHCPFPFFPLSVSLFFHHPFSFSFPFFPLPVAH